MTLGPTAFHWCALAAAFVAAGEGRLHDSAYAKQLTYDLYEGGAFRNGCRVVCRPQPPLNPI